MKRRRVVPSEFSLLPPMTCFGCGGAATIAIRRLGLRFHRYYCHACYRPKDTTSDPRSAEPAKESR